MKKYYLRYWRENALLVGLIFIGAVAQILSSVLNANVLNALIAFDWQAMWVGILWVTGLQLLYVVSLLFKIPYQAYVTQKMITAIRKDITQSIEQLSYQAYHEKHSASLASWLTNDMQTIETNGIDAVYEMITLIFMGIGAIIALLYFHWSILLFSLVSSVITLLLPRLMTKRVQAATLAATEEEEKFMQVITNSLQGFDTLFSYNLLSRITKRIAQGSKDVGKATVHQYKQMTYSAILGATGNVFGQIGVWGLTAFLAFRQIVPIGSIIATDGLSSQLFNSVGNINNYWIQVRMVEPIFEKFDSIQANPDKVYVPFTAGEPTIHLDELAYAYGDKAIFDQLNYTFEAGHKYAIVGKSGSGKTTLLNILNGKLTDYRGSVQLMGNELRDVDGYDIRQEIIYLDQLPFMFEGSIRDNVTLDNVFSDEEVWAALDKAGLTDLVQGLANGLDTDIGEAGRLLSGGQKQRLALARGLIHGKRIILLDEGTSSLDQETALKIEQDLLANPNLTVIMITHHLQDTIATKLDGILSLTPDSFGLAES
ncbi:ABC transporter ATP-binding protein [Aerococcus agrisoli]|uniref:ABC transporter ATP-binding protein n=1 Tax=Aerococcus agrisoli TaxID=2487350 RepID=A0A3N4GDY3_9LACT|nr:ABC transporter ATP-binding protein [Aerococcus agrisoli]RPA60445.1 ABC transporter ATP-binding protein [Aerococcus agrisoli]